MVLRVLIVPAAVVLAAVPALGWRNFTGEANAASGWPGVRMADDQGHVVCVVSFTTPGASFSVPYITLSESSDPSDVTAWNVFDKTADPVLAKRLVGAGPGFVVSNLQIYDYLPPDAWEALGGNAAFLNRQVRVVFGWMKGEKWKSVEVTDYQPDPTLKGVTFDIKAVKDATPMTSLCWGYWAPPGLTAGTAEEEK
jgi:hypothetical protein